MLNLYTEVAVQATPASSQTISQYRIGRAQLTSQSASPHARTEEEYIRRHVASAAGVHFRADRSQTPASYSWKVANDERTLYISSADLTKPIEQQRGDEASTAVEITFDDQIREHTLGFADAIEDDSLEVFLCTSKNEIQHITIPARAFRSENQTFGGFKQWHRTVDASSLTIDTVFRLQVHSANGLFLCFTSGRIQYLTRKTGSYRWEGTTYDDKTWGASFNSLLGRGISRKLEYGSTYVDSRTAQAVQASADSTYLYTVCLNHQLRVWHIPSGKLVVAKDLLDYEGDEQNRTLSAFDRGHIQHLQGVEMRGSILVTYSPRDGGQFKFWDVRGGLTDTLSVTDRYPGVKLTPPDPDPTGTTIWSMVGFRVVPQGELDSRGSAQLWVLWRNNNHHRVYSLQFDLDDIGRAWAEQNWVSSDSISSTDSTPNIVSPGPEAATSQWLEYLTTPRRYPTTVLETALSIYTRNTKNTSDPKWSLQRRLCEAIAPTARPKKQETGGMNFDAFSYEVDQAWRTYHRTVEKLDDARRGPLAFAYNAEEHLPYLVMTDEVAILRESDKLELVLKNDSQDLENFETVSTSRWPHRQILTEERRVSYSHLAQLLSTTSRFVEDLPAETVQDLDATVADLLFLHSERTLTSILPEIYDDLNLGEAVSEDNFARLERGLKPIGGIESINNNLLLAVLDLLPAATPRAVGDHSLVSTYFGSQLQSIDVLESLLCIRRVLSGLISLVIFIEGEFNQEEGAKLADFDAAEIFSNIASIFRTLERNIWLATHFRAANSTTESQQSLLQDSPLKAIQPRADPSQPATYRLMAYTHESLDYISSEDPGYDIATVGLFCDILRRNELQLATEFARFLPATPWATYMRGRLALARQQYDRAEQYFHRAAFGLAHGKASQSLVVMSFDFISEQESDRFYNGLPRYFQHILQLFESVDAHAQAAHFAHATLQSLTTDQRSLAVSFKSEILTHLFSANLKLKRFRDAFDTLTQLTATADKEEQEQSRESAAILIDAILRTANTPSSTRDAITELQSLPWSLHPTLAAELDQQLNVLARKQKSITSTGASNSSGIDYLQIVHALRLAQGDYRGAVLALYDRLKLVQRQGKNRSDPHATAIRHALLALINVMTCVPKDEAYIITEADEESAAVQQGNRSKGKGTAPNGNGDDVEMQDAAQTDLNTNGAGGARKKRRRIIITLADLRRQYQQVLDRCARVERGDFGFSDDEGEEDSADEGYDDSMQIDGVGGGGGGGASRLELTILQNGGGEGRGLADGGTLLAAH